MKRGQMVLWTILMLGGGLNSQAAEFKANIIRDGNPLRTLEVEPTAMEVDATQAVEEVLLKDFVVRNQVKSSLARTDGQFQVTSYYGERVEGKSFSEDLRYEFSDTMFGAVNTAYWMGKLVNEIKAQDFLIKQKMNISVDAHCENKTNAYFSPIMNAVCLGHLYYTLGKKALNGAASTAWDADVSVHELAHGVFHHLNSMPNVLNRNYFSYGNDLLGALNEGQADYQAHVVTGTDMIAPWFMNMFKAYILKVNPEAYDSVKEEKGLRNLKSSRTFKNAKDFGGEIHSDGEIFAATFYDLGHVVGLKKFYKIWLEAISKLTEEDNVHAMAQHLLRADRLLFEGTHQEAMKALFETRGWMGNTHHEDAQVLLKVTDTPEEVDQAINAGRRRGIPWESGAVEPNGNGRLDPGECTPIELAIKNNGQSDLVAVEVFFPKSEQPKGLSIATSTRIYLGVAAGQAISPQTANRTDIRRPWLYACADESFDNTQPLKVILRDATEASPRVVSVSLETTTL